MRNLKSGIKQWNKCGVALVLSAVLLFGACGSDTSAASMRLMRREGEVNISDDAGAEVEPQDNLNLYSGYEVGTYRKSFAWINLDDVKLTKMDQESEIAIQKDGKKLEVEVKSGSLFFNVTEPLEDDETMDIRTSTIAVGIRGTCGWVTENTVALLEGTVTVTAGEQTITVSAGEMAVMTPEGTLEVKKLTAEDIPAFVQEEIADDEKLQEAVRAIEDGTLTGPDDAGADTGGDGTEGQNSTAVSEPVFIPWAEAGLEDHVMDWKDEALAAAMAQETGITDREIMLSDVWEMRSFEPSNHGVEVAKDISDISALAELTNLTGLVISSDNISDISVLASLTNLTQLRLNGQNISDISALAGLTHLTYLSLDNCNISDISALAGLTNLNYYLSLLGNDISDINALAGLTDLTTLRLSRNNISDISALAGMTKLTDLELGNNNISDISALAGLTNLEHLYLNDNNISDISALENMTNLVRLLADRNHIRDISALSGLTSLNDVNLGTNEISDVSALSSLTGLTTLYLNDNNISDVSALADLVNLSWLHLKGNNISDYSPVEFVQALTK